MARYIDADAFIEDIKTEAMNLFFDGMKGTPRPRKELYDIIDRIQEQPTADVVPKSEVDILKSLITYKEEEAYNKGYEDGKADNVSEIFAEIDKELDKARIKYRNQLDSNGVIYTNYARAIIAELKKKYTE